MATKAEHRVLHAVVRGEAFWGTVSGAYGQRDENAAQALKDAGLVRIVPLDSHTPGERRYVAIPPNCEWDFVNNSVRRPTGA